ncbi:hypothetical protein [Micromonospora marina]
MTVDQPAGRDRAPVQLSPVRDEVGPTPDEEELYPQPGPGEHGPGR